MDSRAAIVAWYCKSCGRVEAPAGERYCPMCVAKMVRCSRYEWFLSDELNQLLASSGRDFRIVEQYAVPDHRGFNWHFDIYVWVQGSSYYGGYAELIEVNGEDHDSQKNYSGPGGGYTRDYDKHWEVFSNLKAHKRGIDYRIVPNEKCAKKGGVVRITAKEIVQELLHRADTWC